MIKTLPPLDRTKVRFIIVVVSFIVILLLVICGMFSQNEASTNNMDSTANRDTDDNITQSVTYDSFNNAFNLFLGDAASDDNSNTISSDEIISIYDMLEYTLQLNNVDDYVPDITIRNGTYSRELIDANRLIYQTTFMLDIPSLQQSYYVSKAYSPLPADQSGLYDYDTLVLCPGEDQLIYAPFDCMDRIKYEQ